MKKIVIRVINAVACLVIALAVYMLLLVVITPSGEVPSMFGCTVFRTLTGSMSPEIPRDSMIVVKKCDPETICVGDVITFYSADPDLGGAVNTHRVTQIEKEESRLVFTTKGDANALEDRYKVEQDQLIGKVIFVSVILGKAVRLTSNPLVFIPIIVIPLIIILIVNVRRVWLAAKEIEQEELEEEVQALRVELDKIQQKRTQKAAQENAEVNSEPKE